MKLNKFDIVLLFVGAGIIFSEFPDMSQITQTLPFMMAQFFYVFYFILLAKQSIWAFAVSILAIID